MFRPLSSRCRRRAFSFVEMLISLALLSLLSIITISGMMMHARMAQSNMSQQQVAESSRRFVDAAQIAALDATIIRVDTGPAGPGTVLTLAKPNPNVTDEVLFTQFAYLDTDGNPATIDNNILVVRNADTPMATTGKQLVDLCSPVPGRDIFTEVANAARPLYNINMRVGDRTSPPSPQDNAITGRGFQSFLVSSSISKL